MLGEFSAALGVEFALAGGDGAGSVCLDRLSRGGLVGTSFVWTSLGRDAEGRRREEVRDMVGKEKRRGLLGLRLVFTLYIQNSILSRVNRKGFWIYFRFVCYGLGGIPEV